MLIALAIEANGLRLELFHRHPLLQFFKPVQDDVDFPWSFRTSKEPEQKKPISIPTPTPTPTPMTLQVRFIQIYRAYDINVGRISCFFFFSP